MAMCQVGPFLESTQVGSVCPVMSTPIMLPRHRWPPSSGVSTDHGQRGRMEGLYEPTIDWAVLPDSPLACGSVNPDKRKGTVRRDAPE